MKRIAVTVLAMLSACSKSSSPSAGSGTGAAPPAATAPARAEVDPAKLLADEKKVAAMALYQKEMLPELTKGMRRVVGAVAQGARDGEKIADSMKKDGQLDTYNEANKAALAKSGLTQEEANALTTALGEYTMSLAMAQDAMDQQAKDPKKAAGLADALNKAYLEELEKNKKKLVEKYGQAALDNVQKHEAGFAEIGKAQLKAVLGK